MTDYIIGKSKENIPYIKGGSGDKKIVFFTGMDAIRYPLEKLAHLFNSLYTSFIPENYEYWILGYNHHLLNKDALDIETEDFRRFIEREIGKCNIIAISFGGFIAIPFVEKYPEFVEKFILVGGHYVFSENGALFIEKLIEKVEGGMDNSGIERMFNKNLIKRFTWKLIFNILLLSNSIFIGILSYTEKEQVIIAKRLLEYGFHNKKYLKEIENKLNLIKNNTFIICTDDDVFFSIESYKKLHRAIKNSKLYIFKKEKHMFILEKRKELKKKIVKFLKTTKNKI